MGHAVVEPNNATTTRLYEVGRSMACQVTVPFRSIRLKRDSESENLSLFIAVLDKTGQAAIIYAAAEGHTNIIQLLLQRTDVNSNVLNKHGQTALILAVARGHVDAVKLLLQRADIDPNIIDDAGQTALICAVDRRHTEIVQLLLQNPSTDSNIL